MPDDGNMFMKLAVLPEASPSVQQRGGHYLTACAGMPSPDGCDATITTIDPATQVGDWDRGGTAGRWLVTYGWDGEGDDKSYLLAFCPDCAAVVRAQEVLYVGEVPC